MYREYRNIIHVAVHTIVAEVLSGNLFKCFVLLILHIIYHALGHKHQTFGVECAFEFDHQTVALGFECDFKNRHSHWTKFTNSRSCSRSKFYKLFPDIIISNN